MKMLYCIIAALLITINAYLYQKETFKKTLLINLSYLLPAMYIIQIHSSLTGNIFAADMIIMGFIILFIAVKPDIRLSDKITLPYDYIYKVLLLMLFIYYIPIRRIDFGYQTLSTTAWITTFWVTTVILIISVSVAIKIGFIKFNGWKVDYVQAFNVAVYMFYFTALPEEFIFRGILYGYLAKVFPSIILPLLLSSVIFGVAHYKKGTKMILLSIIAGIGYCCTYIFTKNLYCAMIIHTIVNLTWKSFFTTLSTQPIKG